MKAAIKVGPKDGVKILQKSQAKYAEIWFRLDWQEQYFPLFEYMRKNQIAFGLHFWATVEQRYFPNLLYLRKKLAEKTYKLILQTIDIATANKADYVVFHPEAYRLGLLDLDKKTTRILHPHSSFNREKSFQQLLFYLGKISKYAQEKGVMALIETVPKYTPADFKNIIQGRLSPQKSEGLETEKFFQLAKMDFPICLDIEHTMSQLITDNREELFQYLITVVKKLQPAVKLMHITTKIPPYNGTDTHCGILAKDFKRKGVIPNKEELIKILSLFKDRDIWLIPEPHEKMIENHLVLKKLVEEIEEN